MNRERTGVMQPPLPADVCSECAVGWEDIGEIVGYRRRPDGAWEPMWMRDRPPGERPTPEPSEPALSWQTKWSADRRRKWEVVTADQRVIGAVEHVGKRAFVAWLFTGDGFDAEKIDTFSAGRYALRALVKRATGYEIATRWPKGMRQADYLPWT